MIDTLNDQFSIPNALTVTEGNGGLPKVVLTHPSGSSAEVYLHGAHVTSWKNKNGDELFFLSRESNWAKDKPIRGGIPVIFPQFGGNGPLPQHGFARTSEWQIWRTDASEAGIVTAEFHLKETPETMNLWPHPFAAWLTVLLDENTLTIRMKVQNTSYDPFDFQAAFHTYFQVAEIGKTAVGGLKGVTYIDSLRNDVREVEEPDEIRFDQETDRVYVNAPDTLQVKDEGNGRTITITKSNMPDVVVWNPWIAKSQRMADFGDHEFLHMVCVETGSIETRPCLKTTEAWEGETTFKAE